MFGLLLLKECSSCGGAETRLFTDSWTGLELCSECLTTVLPYTTMSPEEEGDNLTDLLRTEQDGPLYCEEGSEE